MCDPPPTLTCAGPPLARAPPAAEALNVEPAATIAAAAKPIAILRIMMLTPFVLSTPAFPNQTQQFPLSCSVRHSRRPSGLRHPSGRDRNPDVLASSASSALPPVPPIGMQDADEVTAAMFLHIIVVRGKQPCR